MPRSIAPFDVVVTVTNMGDANLVATAEQVAKQLEDAGFDVLLDDRDERAGVKFKDADLVGIPYRINVGKKAAEGRLELVTRSTATSQDVAIAEIAPAAASSHRNRISVLESIVGGVFHLAVKIKVVRANLLDIRCATRSLIACVGIVAAGPGRLRIHLRLLLLQVPAHCRCAAAKAALRADGQDLRGAEGGTRRAEVERADRSRLNCGRRLQRRY